MVPVFLPAIQAEFGLTVRELTWFFNSYGIAVAIGVLLGGWLGDKFATKSVFAAGVLFFALGSVWVAIAESYQLIIAARWLQGFGGGIFSPLVPILLTKASPERPGRILILWGSATGYVAATGPLLFSTVLVDLGWQIAFVLFSLVSIFALTMVLFAPRTGLAPERSFTPLDHGRVLRSRELWMMFGYIFCTYGAISFFAFCLPIELTKVGVSVFEIGLLLSVMWITFSVASTLLRNKIDEHHIRSILTVAPFFIALGFGVAHFSENFYVWLLASVLVGAGLACSNAPSTMLVLKFAPKGGSAFAASLDISFARIGGVFAIFMLAQASFLVAVIGIGMLSFIAVALAFLATRKLKQNESLTELAPL